MNANSGQRDLAVQLVDASRGEKVYYASHTQDGGDAVYEAPPGDRAEDDGVSQKQNK